jgi:hypothetical protein
MGTSKSHFIGSLTGLIGLAVAKPLYGGMTVPRVRIPASLPSILRRRGSSNHAQAPSVLLLSSDF